MSVDNPWLPNTVFKDGDKITVSDMAEPLDKDKMLPTFTVVTEPNKYKYKYMSDFSAFDLHYGTGFGKTNIALIDKYFVSVVPKFPDLDMLDDKEHTKATEFAQHHWGTTDIHIKGISVQRLMAGYAEYVSKDIRDKIMADIKNKQRNACVPRHKKNARKFRPA